MNLRELKEVKNLGYVPASLYSLHEDRVRFEDELFRLGYAQVTYNPFSRSPRPKRVDGVVPDGMKLIVHAPYFICLAREDKDSEKSLKIMKLVIQWASALKAESVVTHVGYRGVSGKFSISVDQAKEALYRNVLRLAPLLEAHDMSLMLENTAGAKTGYPFGYTNEIIDVLSMVHKRYVRLAFDTCHSYVSGEGVSLEWFTKFSSMVGLVHLNPSDSKGTLGSCRDRHSMVKILSSEHIDKGFLKGLFQISSCPVILERGDLNFVIDDVRYLLT